jgi:DNA repair exonuclease SbcCD ATPase subunit
VALELYYAVFYSEKDAEIERLEDCLSALHPICDSADALIAMHSASKEQARELEQRVNEAKAALAAQRDAHADLLVVIEELAPFVDEVNDQDRELQNWEEAFELLVRDKNAEILELEEHIGALEPVCDAVEALVELLDEGVVDGLDKLSA